MRSVALRILSIPGRKHQVLNSSARRVLKVFEGWQGASMAGDKWAWRRLIDDVVSSIDHGRYVNFIWGDLRKPYFSYFGILVSVNQIKTSDLIYNLKGSA